MKHDTNPGLHPLLSLLTTLLIIGFTTPYAMSFDLVLDPGHSPKSRGATSCNGIPESWYNYRLVTEIAEHIARKDKTIRISITRGAENNASLYHRVKIAGKKDLFLSVHHDSVQPQYLHEIHEHERKKLCSNKYRGFSLFISKKNRFYKESLDYAQKLGNSLLSKGMIPSLHHAEDIPGERRKLINPSIGLYEFDDLFVLKNSQMPAVLLEAGVIVNPQDEAFINQQMVRQNIAQSIYEMIRGHY